ncbi:heavy-metal-associated domain-containing protein [Cryobacterium aureum]|uniref:cation transporter n=1 Tax=Cryobacterium aureum TaxID=995037 RepID=UPI000CF53E69
MSGEVAVSGEQVVLDVGGMTCASCAARIEKKLNRVPGVEASVNYSTEKASVFVPLGTSVADAIATIEATGYTAVLPRSVVSDEPHSEEPTDADREVSAVGVLAGPRCRALEPTTSISDWRFIP